MYNYFQTDGSLAKKPLQTGKDGWAIAVLSDGEEVTTEVPNLQLEMRKKVPVAETRKKTCSCTA